MSENCCAGSGCCCRTPPKDAVPTVSTRLSFKDRLGACKVRWDIGRTGYRVDPGLYAVGKPCGTSPVLVSANYKLTFDTLRKDLEGLDCWLLILDTKGINVWCAAGKGTFGTEELIGRIEKTGFSEIVAHRRLILPQLGASGVNANEVAQRSGYTVMFGPVRPCDIKRYIANGFKATREMRTVQFTVWDRLVLVPVEVVAAVKKSFPVFAVMFLANLFAVHPFDVRDAALYAGALFAGTVCTPLLLPIVPGKMFAPKGWLLGLLWTACALWFLGWFAPGFRLPALGWLLFLPSVSAYLAMNFTGASTYTSPSGVAKEMALALPFIVIMSIAGAALVLVEKLLG